MGLFWILWGLVSEVNISQRMVLQEDLSIFYLYCWLWEWFLLWPYRISLVFVSKTIAV